MESILTRLNEIGFEKVRRALAALVLSLFVSLYLLLSLNVPPATGLGPMLLAMGACYLVAFLSVSAEWFWGRWFASGLGWSGIMISVAAMVQAGAWIPVLGIFGGLHALVVVALLGKKMAERYDLQSAWRERYGMDEFGVARLRKTVTRAAAALPSVIAWALAPREGQGMLLAAAGIATLLTAAAGLRYLIYGRTAGWLMLTGACASLWLLSSATGTGFSLPVGTFFTAETSASALTGVPVFLATVFLTLATVPFAAPALRYLTRRQS